MILPNHTADVLLRIVESLAILAASQPPAPTRDMVLKRLAALRDDIQQADIE